MEDNAPKCRKPVNVEVRIEDFYNVEQMIKRFCKKVKKNGVLETYHKKRFFKSKSELKREIKQKAMRKRQLENKKATKSNKD